MNPFASRLNATVEFGGCGALGFGVGRHLIRPDPGSKKNSEENSEK